MPPDADSLRQRRTNDDISTAAEQVEPTETTQEERLCSISKLRTNEICIDGIIYDVGSFVHPGGDSVLLFGGNDVTVQYKMIHPYHTSKHLEKMQRLGKVVDYTTEYKFDTPFEREMKREVFKIVPRGREFATTGFLFRASFYVILYLVLLYQWISKGSSWQLAVVYGIAHALIGLNVQHDANHGAISKKYPIINDVLGYGADFIGGNKWLWIQQHLTHHAFTNSSKDPDSSSAEPLILFKNYPDGHPNRKWFHRFQPIFCWALFAAYWLSTVLDTQVAGLRQRGASAAGLQFEHEFVRQRCKGAVALRILYLYIHAVYPFQYHGVGLRALGDILILGASGSLCLATLFSISHNFEDTDLTPTAESKKDDDGKVCWFKSQVESSCTYGGAIAGGLSGGLNFQVEHHLFPRMSSAWYPYIAPTVRSVCAKHGIRYAYYPGLAQNLRATINHLGAIGAGNIA